MVRFEVRSPTPSWTGSRLEGRSAVSEPLPPDSRCERRDLRLVGEAWRPRTPVSRERSSSRRKNSRRARVPSSGRRASSRKANSAPRTTERISNLLYSVIPRGLARAALTQPNGCVSRDRVRSQLQLPASTPASAPAEGDSDPGMHSPCRPSCWTSASLLKSSQTQPAPDCAQSAVVSQSGMQRPRSCVDPPEKYDTKQAA